jgi:uncharacterized membrane protein
MVRLGNYGRSFGIGAIAGLRAFTPAFALQQSSGGKGALALGMTAFGELIGDKLPITPSRLSPPALLGRLTAGAGIGSLVAKRSGANAAVGALLGAFGAAAGAQAGYRLRRAIVQRTGWPDPVVGLIEDGIAVGGAFALLRRS